MFNLFSRGAGKSRMTAAQAVETRDRVLLLDVRDAGEIRQSGKAEGAICIPLTVLGFRADPRHPEFDRRLDPQATICVYCAAGGRAGSAQRMLEGLGYTNVHAIGGLRDWVAAGGKVERG